MSLFIDTTNISDNEKLIQAIKENNLIARNMRKEISELKNIELIEESDTEEFYPEECSLELNEIDDDFEYDYYYEPIRNMATNTDLECMKQIINDCLPLKSNSNYFKLINRIKIEIVKEISSLISMYNETSDDEFKNDIKENIDFEKKKLIIVNEIEKSKELQDETVTENNIVFTRTNSGNIYALEDIKSINNEYYASILELYESIKNGTFKKVKRLTTSNNKANSVSEVRGFKTRIIFDKLNQNTYVILQIAIKKSDFDKGYKESLEKRVSSYKLQKETILNQLNDEIYMSENTESENKLVETLSQNKKKVMMPNE